MIKFVLAFAAFGFAVSAQAEKPKTVNARNSKAAATMKVDDPSTLICVRRKLTNSRTKTRRVCLTSDQWKTYELELRDTRDQMNSSRP